MKTPSVHIDLILTQEQAAILWDKSSKEKMSLHEYIRFKCEIDIDD